MDKDVIRKFMQQSTFRMMGQPGQALGLPQPDLADAVPYGNATVALPAPGDVIIPPIDLRKAIEARRSVRAYSDQPLALSELSYLLWVSQGVVQITPRPATLRNVPSAGSRHPFETYLLVNRVSGLEAGLYKYAALDHRLVVMDLSSDRLTRFTSALAGQPLTIMTGNAVTFIWVAVAGRSTWRYAERAYRFMHLDAGHVCQNLSLGAVSIGSGCCAIGGYHDDIINELLKLDGEERFVIYAAAVGKTQI